MTSIPPPPLPRLPIQSICALFLRRISCWKTQLSWKPFNSCTSCDFTDLKIYTFMGRQWMVRKLSCTEWAALLQKAQSLRFKNTPVTHKNCGQRYQVHRFGPLLPHAFSSKPSFLFLKGFSCISASYQPWFQLSWLIRPPRVAHRIR